MNSRSGGRQLEGDRERAPQIRPEPVEPQDFSPMREAAYRAFLRDSEELHMAHLEPSEPNRVLVYLRWYLQIVLAVLSWRVLPFPEPPSRCRRSRAACEARHTNRHLGRASVTTMTTSKPTGSGSTAIDQTEPAVTMNAAEPAVPADRAETAAPTDWDPLPLADPSAISVEWRSATRNPAPPATARHTGASTPARPAPTPRAPASPLVQSAPVWRPDPPRPRRPHRPHPVMAPRNGARSRRRADTRRIFLHTYGMTRDQNHRNLNWPRGSWAGFDISATCPANPRRGAIKRRRNRRPRNLALARSFPTTTPAVPVGATSRLAPIARTARLLPLAAPQLPAESLSRMVRRTSQHRSRGGTNHAPMFAFGGLR
jgi:hypothetical protein